MSKLTSPYGKPLKGESSASASANSGLADYVIAAISSGSVPLANVDITGGTISNTTIGQDGAGPFYGTTITTGAPNGTGYDIYFYGDTLGEYANWNATLGVWSIFGDTYTSGASDMGNIRISGNTISSTNTNGDIILDPAGTGCLVINSCIDQSSAVGDVSFDITNGSFISNTTGEFNSVSTQEAVITSNNGDIILTSGASKVTTAVTNISTGATPTVTTGVVAHFLEAGDSIKLTGTNSVPPINGSFTVTNVIDQYNFTITPGFPVTTFGSSGSFIKNTDIYLNSSDNINIPYNVKLTFGSDSNYISDTIEDFNIATAGDINLTPSIGKDVNIPDSIGLTFGLDSNKIESSGTTLSISSTLLNVDSTNVSFTDPILKIDSVTPLSNSGKDKGLEFNYYDTSAKLGWFGYDNSQDAFSFFKSATNTGEVISGTLGDARFAAGSFTSINLNGGNVSAGSIDTCNINCNGLMTLSGVTGIKLNTPSVIIPQGSQLRFGETGSPVTSIYKEASGDDLVIQSQGHVFVTPGGTAYDVIVPSGSALVLNGESGSQKLESISNTELSISSSSFLNLNQISGGVRLTENLPLVFNTAENSKITGDSSGNLIVNSGNSINLIPNSGQVTIPVNKRIELGSSTTYLGTSDLNTVVLTTPGTISATSTGSQTFTSSSGDINLTPNGAVILPVNKALQLGSATEFLKSDGSNNLLLSSTGSQTFTTSSSIQLNPTTFVNIPYTKPLQFGSSLESITGTSGNLSLTAVDTSVSGNFTVNGTTTTINSTVVTISDPILTLGQGIVDDNKDRGIEYRYNNGTTQKLGYFGMDDTDNTFMFVPDATNTSEVISGALGNVKFAGASLTSLNLNNGTISAVNIVSSNNDLVLDPGTGEDVVFNNDSGSNIIVPQMVDLVFGNENNKIYSDGTNLHVVNNLMVDGPTTINGDLVVTGNVSIVGGNTVNMTIQRISVAGGGSSNPNSSSNCTFITTLSSGVATGVIPAASIDGFVKQICMVSLFTGSSYELTFPTGRLLDPGTGTTVAKKMIFDCAGQSVQLVWDNVSQFYIITQGGGELVLV
jgi:hypothetical protein